jgi:flavin-dependent dehydrogenase
MTERQILTDSVAEISRRSPLSKEAEKETYTPVLIIGGSLSGLTLSKSLSEHNIDHIVIEATKANKCASVHYLTSQSAAKELGLEEYYDEQLSHRKAITGYFRFDSTKSDLVPLEKVEPDNDRSGFATFSLAELRGWFKTPIIDGTSVRAVSETNDSNWLSQTTDGKKISSKIVIDTTGARTHIVGSMINSIDIKQEVGNRIVRACYGGIYPYNGPENSLLFVDQFPITDPSLPREGAGWVMPIGNGQAEVVVGWETKLADINKWRGYNTKILVQQYINWFNERGIVIDFNERHEVVSGFFSQELLNYHKIPKDKGIAVFGEALGLNHPLNGYLIKNIAGYAETMTKQIELFLKGEKWDPHNKLVGNSPINFGQQVAISRRKMEAAKNGIGRSAATRDLQEFLIKSIGYDGLWSAIDNGVPFVDLVKGLLQHPLYASTICSLGIDYAKILMNENLYRKELIQKLKNKVFESRRQSTSTHSH